jgi:MoaA/NifB/PqqE/SkfB family radical SAM enzyme
MIKPPVPEHIKRATRASCASGYFFDWNIYIACNYRCPYCYFEGHWDELKALNRVPPFETIVAAWKRVYDAYGESFIAINGGEPTVYPKFMELMIALSRWHQWTFNTNLWWDLARWRSFAGRIDTAKGRIQISCHPTEIGDFEAFADKAAAVGRLGFAHCQICIVVYPAYMDELRGYCDRLKRTGLTVRLQPFAGEHLGKTYPHAYTPEEKALIRELSLETDSSLLSEMAHAIGDSNPLGKPCRSGQYYCHINQQGDVHRCTQVDQRLGDKIGNFFDGFEFLPEPTPCPMSFCRCGESQWLVENCG